MCVRPSLELAPKFLAADERGLVVAVPWGEVRVLLGELPGLHADCCKGRCHHDLLLGRRPSPANREAEVPASPLAFYPLPAVLLAVQTRQADSRRGWILLGALWRHRANLKAFFLEGTQKMYSLFPNKHWETYIFLNKWVSSLDIDHGKHLAHCAGEEGAQTISNEKYPFYSFLSKKKITIIFVTFK